MSARISGVKNFESKATSLLRGLPLSQVQSQSEKGSIFAFFVGAAEESPDGCATIACAGNATSKGAAFAGTTGARDALVVASIVAFVVMLVVMFVVAVRLFNSASSCSMRAFIASNSFAISAATGSGAAAGRAEDTSGAAGGSCKTATFVGASDCVGDCA